MKKLLGTLLLCLFAVTIMLKDGKTMTADRVICFKNNAVVLQTGENYFYLPNWMIRGIVYEPGNHVKDHGPWN